MTKSNVKQLFPVLLLFTLLISCSPLAGGGGGVVDTKAATPTVSVAPGSSPLPTSSTEDVCPGSLAKYKGCFAPRPFRLAYGVEALSQKGYTGKGQTIIDIVSFGSPTLKQDMAVYDKQFGLPPVDLEIISPLTDVKEYDPRNDKSGWAAETTLDVQVIHAIAPEAKIIVLTSPVAEIEGTIGLPEFRRLQQYVIDNNLGKIVSQSWGVSELTLQDKEGQDELKKWNDFYQKAASQGMTYLSSSGDGGATDYEDLMATKLASVQTTSFPADSPWVTAVGGTTLIRNGQSVTEHAWNGSGGGFSRFYSTPTYQKGLSADIQKQLNNRRGVPDVSGSADPGAGLPIYFDGQWTIIGGTSASAPLWAGITALGNQMAGKPLGFLNPALYQIAAGSTYADNFRDITVGDNTNHAANVKGYPAVKGWDPVTGLGSPNAEKLLPALIAATK